MASSNSGTADNTTGGTPVVVDETVAQAIYVQNLSGDTELEVNVPVVHGVTSFDIVQPGDTGKYYSKLQSIDEFFVQTDSGTAAWRQGILMGGAPAS